MTALNEAIRALIVDSAGTDRVTLDITPDAVTYSVVYPRPEFDTYLERERTERRKREQDLDDLFRSAPKAGE